MTKVIQCNGPDCQVLLPDGDSAVITEWVGFDGTLHPNSKAKYEHHYCTPECARQWTEGEAKRREQLRAEDMDVPDDELWEDDNIIAAPCPPALIALRCWRCYAQLGRFGVGTRYEIKCPRCNTMNSGRIGVIQ